MHCLLSLFSDVFHLGLEYPFMTATVMGVGAAVMLGGR